MPADQVHGPPSTTENKEIWGWRMSGAVLATYDDHGVEKILLGRRLKNPNFGKWVLPGGGAEVGEDTEMAAAREVEEETGVKVTDLDLIETTDHQEGHLGKRIQWFKCKIVDPKDLRGGDDLGDPQLFSREELTKLEDVSDVVRPILELAGWLPGSE